MEVYDILDSSVMDSIGFREFCSFVFLVSAAQDGLLLRCLFDHGALLFDILGAGQPVITGERLKVLGSRVLSLNDDILEEISETMGFKSSSIIGFEEFQVFYYEVFKTADKAYARDTSDEQTEAVASAAIQGDYQ